MNAVFKDTAVWPHRVSNRYRAWHIGISRELSLPAMQRSLNCLATLKCIWRQIAVQNQRN